jgi:hypothetical protein
MPMPPFVKFVQYAIAASLLALALLGVWSIAARGAAVSGIWFVALCLFAIVGLLRQVAWGRFLVSLISVVSAFSIAANLIPNDDDFYNGGGIIKRLLGFEPQAWLSWLLVVLSALLVLLPCVIIGWRKAWFRSGVW